MTDHEDRAAPEEPAPRSDNPLAGLPPVEHDFNRNPLDLGSLETPSAASGGGGGGGRLFFGIILLVAGIALLVFASSHAPTLDNALTQEYVLKPGAYNAARVAGWASAVLGGLLTLSGLVRSNG